MKLLSSIVRALRQGWEAFKGPHALRVVHVHQDPRDGYLVKTSAGQFIEIFCRELVHEVTYRHWWMPKQRKRMYQVYCVYSMDTPPGLKHRLDKDFTLPRQLHRWAPRASQKKAVIDKYIDSVLNHLRIA